MEWINASFESPCQSEILTRLWEERSIDHKAINTSEIKANIRRMNFETELIQNKANNQRFINSILLWRIAAVFIIFSIFRTIYLMTSNIERINLNDIIHQFIKKLKPPGQTNNIYISGGSVARLNANSSKIRIAYVTCICRIEILNYEDSFDVAEDSHDPFRADAKAVNVENPGMEAGKPDKGVTVALIEGGVKILIQNNKDGRGKHIIYQEKGIAMSRQHDRMYNFTFDRVDLYPPYSGCKEGILAFNGDNNDEFVS